MFLNHFQSLQVSIVRCTESNPLAQTVGKVLTGRLVSLCIIHVKIVTFLFAVNLVSLSVTQWCSGQVEAVRTQPLPDATNINATSQVGHMSVPEEPASMFTDGSDCGVYIPEPARFQHRSA